MVVPVNNYFKFSYVVSGNYPLSLFHISSVLNEIPVTYNGSLLGIRNKFYCHHEFKSNRIDRLNGVVWNAHDTNELQLVKIESRFCENMCTFLFKLFVFISFFVPFCAIMLQKYVHGFYTRGNANHLWDNRVYAQLI